jgi:hypothetical protein
MYVYIYIYIYMCVCVYVCMYVCILVQCTGVNIRFLLIVIKESDGNVFLQFINMCHN